MGVDNILINFSNSTASAIWVLLWALGRLMGICTVAFALHRLVRTNADPTKSPVTIGQTVPLLIVGSLMFNLSTMINKTWNSMSSGEVSFDAISYEPASGFGYISSTVNASLTLVAVFGGIFFLKGLLLLKRGVLESQGSNGVHGGDLVSRALTHMIGGSLLINIPAVLDLLYQSIS